MVQMSGYLLDTHTLIWAVRIKKKLSSKAIKILENPNSLLYVSSLSVWEIHMKHRLGKLPEADDLVADFEGSLRRLNAFDLQFTREHAIEAARVQLPHGDPFDRGLFAQAKLENLTLISADTAFEDVVGVKVLW
jgi:PIN domain nuclease of toxin-antitoxin system